MQERLKTLAVGWAAAAGLMLAAPSYAQNQFRVSGTQPTSAGEPGARSLDGSEGSGKAQQGTATYLVQLQDAPEASYMGGVAGLAPTANAVTGAETLDVNSEASRAYESYLALKQRAFGTACDAALGREVQPSFVYRHAFNGMAIEITEEEAVLLRAIPGVKSVTREKTYRLDTDVGPTQINAPLMWDGQGGKTPTMGEGVVIAVLDSGINSDHPSFAATAADGYTHTNPLGSGNYVPGSWCIANPSFCNDKLIGAWAFVRGATDPTSPEDSDGHGSHTAATAGGNEVYGASIAAPTTSFTRNVSGVAPRANIIAYDVCIDSCPGAALIAAVNQVVIDAAALPDGIHSLNYSISGGANPYSDAVELAFLNATAAGVYVSASGGNSGPGPSTLGHQSPWVATVAALTHNRRIDNTLTNLSSSGNALSDILGAGLTSAYGPAAIVYAGNFPTANGTSNDTEPEQCLVPFPAGTFNGEIVVCDRGSIARVAKGANVLAGGAGGFVLANTAAQGESISADAHFLPGVHIGANDGVALRAWLAAETNTMATIAGFSVDLSPANGDVVAGFSSRGPNSAVDVIKPDIGAPGVSVMAAVNTTAASTGPEYNFLSGTSMSSPHNAGAGALLAAITNWTPYEIKSALMMTARPFEAVTKEDLMAPADPFDTGAGRIDLQAAPHTGLLMDETPANFTAANPEIGGDPKTLNLPSFMDSNCVGECSFTRTFKNATNRRQTYTAEVDGPFGFVGTVSPRRFSVDAGATKTVTFNADVGVAPEGWNFGKVRLTPRGASTTRPILRLPVAVQKAHSTLPGVFTSTAVSPDTTAEGYALAANGDRMTYTMRINNGLLSGPITMTNDPGRHLRFIPGTLTQSVTGGTTTSPFTLHSDGTVSWSGSITPQGLAVAPAPSPAGFLPLSALGVAPFGCPGNCDDGGFIVNTDPFVYNGETYTQVIWSVNGTVEAGTASLSAASASNQNLPDGNAPNNLLAPFWTDLNMGVNGDGAEWYTAALSGGGRNFQVFEWNNIPLFGDTTNRYSFQIWIETGTSGNIWFTYGAMGSTNINATVGVENADGTVGTSYFYNGTGTVPAGSLGISSTPGGSATFSVQAEAKACPRRRIQVRNEATLTNGTSTHRALSVAHCQKE